MESFYELMRATCTLYKRARTHEHINDYTHANNYAYFIHKHNTRMRRSERLTSARKHTQDGISLFLCAPAMLMHAHKIAANVLRMHGRTHVFCALACIMREALCVFVCVLYVVCFRGRIALVMGLRDVRIRSSSIDGSSSKTRTQFTACARLAPPFRWRRQQQQRRNARRTNKTQRTNIHMYAYICRLLRVGRLWKCAWHPPTDIIHNKLLNVSGKKIKIRRL